MSAILESLLATGHPDSKAAADAADAAARKARALAHYTAEAAKAAKLTDHERVRAKLADTLAYVKAQTWADESAQQVIEDLEAACVHWEAVYATDWTASGVRS